MATKSSELANIMKGLADQGVRYRENSKGGFVVYFPDGATETFSASTDPRAIRSQRASVRRHGLHWPLDPTTPERKEKPAATKQRPVEPKPMPNPEPAAANPTVIPTVASATVQKVDANLAEQWLSLNTANRKLSDKIVAKYAALMKDGQWHYDGSPIRFDVKGELIDGQHRLWAIIESGTTQEFLVLTGLRTEAFATIDTGKARNFADILSIAHPELGQFTSHASVTKLIYQWERGARGSQLLANRSEVISPEVLLEYLEANQEAIIEANLVGRRISQRVPIVTGSVGALTYWVLSDIDEDDCEDFLDKLISGAGLAEGNPILALRNFFYRSASVKNQRVPADVQIAVIIKAWNAYRQGREVRVMAFKPGGSTPEAFPIPV